MRAVLDANVLISAILSPRGTPARLVLAWQAGAFDLVVSPLLLAEVRHAMAYPKLVRRVPSGMMVPWTGTTPGISSPVPGGRDFLGKAAASINLIDALDVIDAKGNLQPMPENAKPISNKVTVQLTFE